MQLLFLLFGQDSFERLSQFNYPKFTYDAREKFLSEPFLQINKPLDNENAVYCGEISGFDQFEFVKAQGRLLRKEAGKIFNKGLKAIDDKNFNGMAFKGYFHLINDSGKNYYVSACAVAPLSNP